MLDPCLRNTTLHAYQIRSMRLRELGSAGVSHSKPMGLPKLSVVHFWGKDIFVSAEASRGSSPVVTEDMVVA